MCRDQIRFGFYSSNFAFFILSVILKVDVAVIEFEFKAEPCFVLSPLCPSGV